MGAVHFGVPGYSDLNIQRQKHCGPTNLRKIRRISLPLRVSLVHSHKCLKMDFGAPVQTSSFEKCALTEDLKPGRKIQRIPLTQWWLINILFLCRFLTYYHACCTDGDTATDIRIARSDNQLGLVWVRKGWSLLKWKNGTLPWVIICFGTN